MTPSTPTPRGRCLTHNRELSHREYMARVCFWCHPEDAPSEHPVHKLSPAQIAALQEPGVRT